MLPQNNSGNEFLGNNRKNWFLHWKLEIIELIISERAKEKLTQRALAEKIGVKQRHMSRLESGIYNPSLEFLFVCF